MAAELSKKMLQRNDELQEELDRLKMHDSFLVEVSHISYEFKIMLGTCLVYSFFYNCVSLWLHFHILNV